MRFEQRAFRYLWRKKSKSILLFCILLVISTMILASTMILQTAQVTSRSIQQKTNAKLVLQSQDGKNRITPEIIARIITFQDVSAINRMATSTAYPSGFFPVTASDSPKPENLMVTLQAYDNTGTDGVFSEEKYRMLEGNAIDAEHPQGILVDSILAEANGLALGSQIEFETEDGKTASGTIIGIFFSGMERKQETSILSAYRIENRIFVDHTIYEALFGVQGYSYISVFTSHPERMDELYDDIQQVIEDEISITTSDTLYTAIQAPLQQVIQITTVMLVLTLITAVIVVSLLLCMWMRTRQKEFAVLISLGESKWSLVLQVVTEGLALFLMSVVGATFCTNLFSGEMVKRLFSSEDFSSMMNAHIQWEHLVSLIALGGLIVIVSIGISVLPTLQANPRDTLSRMEG